MFSVNKFKYGLWVLALLAFLPAAVAQRQMEKLGRGIVAVRAGPGSAYVGWRLLGTDAENVGFNLLRSANGGALVQLNGALITSSCNFTDNSINFAVSNAYFIQPVVSGVTQTLSAPFGLSANAPTQQYLNIPLQQPTGGTTADGVPYTYNANDCSAADLDGDGEYEIILKWDPTNAKDNSQSGFTGNVFLDAYKLNGTLLWRIDLGQNIRAGAHYTQFMVYDLDGDGRAELACKTAPGTRDGLGNYVDGNAAFTVYTNSGGYILSGPEYFTIFDGLTGAKLWNTNYIVPRGNVSDWGDSYGNRVDRFLACVAYLDGVRPSVVMCRGYYTRATLCAWDWRNGVLTQRWLFDTGFSGGPWSGYKGQGAHSLTVGDVDGDGKDEITFGACAIDDNGTGLYTTGLGHGDALHQSDMNPDRNGLEVWMVHESPSSYGPNGLEFRDAKNGGLIFGVDGQGADIGRGVAIDIDPSRRGYEMWGSRGGLMSATGVQISSSRPGQMNFACWWDADTIREILDGTTISKWNPATSSSGSILSPGGISSNNGTKSTPALSVDLFGDWREEVIWRTSDNSSLRIYTTTAVATNRLVTLMHDPTYRVAIAWQNVAYNQPPHPGYYIGPGMFTPPLPPISTADLVWRGGGANLWDAGVTANWFTNGLWVSNNTPVAFSAGRSVLFDISGSNNSPLTLSGTLTPSEVTVYSPKDFSFVGSGQLSGTMKLVKAGPARLIINSTNNYTGATVVSGGAVFVNGALNSSPVTVERRGTPEGPSQFGGGGQLGNGLVVQAGCTLTVGPGINSPGTLTVSNGVTLAGTLNQFDLSNDPAGATKTNDAVQVYGDLTLSGTNTIEIRQLDGFLGGGVYPLIKYTGSLSGGLPNLVLSGTFIQPVALTNPPGMIALLSAVPAVPPVAPSSLVATTIGAFQINLSWTDNASDENVYLLERSPGDLENFALIASLPPNTTGYQDIGLSANTTYFYRVRGTNLAGFSAYSNTDSATTTATPPSLTWRGDGSLNVWDLAATANWRNGAAPAFYADGAFVTFDQSGSNSPAIVLDSPLAPGSLFVNATKSYTFSGGGSLSGATALVKAGSGSLTINTTNTYAGGTIISNGTVLAGTVAANSGGFGGGPITFYGGTLEFVGWTGNSGTEYGGNANTYIIPAGMTGTIRVPQRFSSGLSGTLTGSGTLNLQVKYVRGDVNGNWANFNGAINVTRGNTGATVDDFRVANANGFPNARVSLGTNVLMYSRASANSTIPIGEFRAVPGAVVTAGGCSGNCGAGTQNAVTWRVGGLGTDATNSALFSGTTSLIKEGAGKWILTSDNTYSGTTVVNGGTLIVNGNQSVATGNVTVNANGRLGGVGIVGGNTTVNGMLVPGNAIGPLSFSQNLTLNASSTTQLEISKNPPANDMVIVGGDLTCGGTLDVLNTSVELLEAGDNFQLLSASSFSGAFANYDLPALEVGLAWNVSQLMVDGRLWVVSTNPPVISEVSATSGSFSMSGEGGTPHWNYSVLTSTNLALPLAQWSVVTSGQFDASGNFTFNGLIDPADARRFYVLRAQ
ncbi:MAG TPA: autotransporter-associated beta strand repeat-containing protein [Verrucomicrobiae bacterium]|nr:autotransporter-associated beta strand repeat-containing protein [Verrucomicrobiae bacterium]